MMYPLVFCASATFVFFRAFQQLNVVNKRYLLVIPTSILMGVCEVYVVANVVQLGFNGWLILNSGVGAGLGCMGAMWIHDKMKTNDEK